MTAEFSEQRRLVEPLAVRFHEAGHRLYLVGGVVRDVLRDAGADTPDMDLTTDATPERTRDLVEGMVEAVWLQGQRFGTIGVRLDGHTVEITTHRAEVYSAGSRKPDVSYSTELEEDLVRRDFTVNAMAVDVLDGTLHDPHGGRRDLEAGLLRTPLDPERSFADDPLRMMRAARFVAGHGFTPVDGLVAAARRLAGRLEIVSAERLRDELFRLLALPDPGPGLDLLVDACLLEHILPEVAALDPAALEGVLGRIVSAPAEPLLRMAVVGMEMEAVRLAARADALRMSGRDTSDLMAVVGVLHRVAGHGRENPWTDEQVRRLAAAARDQLGPALDTVTALGVDDGHLAEVVARLTREGELDDLGPALDGAAVMELLGLGTGPEVGVALTWLSELRLTEGRLAAGEAADRLEAWWAQR